VIDSYTMQMSEQALGMIATGVDDKSRQRELADLLLLAEGTGSILDKLKQIPNPRLYLAVAIYRKF
jgi:hypothetical protein